MSGQGNGLGGCRDGCGRTTALIALWLAAFVTLVVLSAACSPQRTGAGTTSTTRENVCGEPGVCEGS